MRLIDELIKLWQESLVVYLIILLDDEFFLIVWDY